MILIDVNVLVAAYREDHPHHRGAGAWLAELIAGEESFTVQDQTWASFIRIVTNRRIFPVPASVDEAFAFLWAVRAQRGYVATNPGPHHLRLFQEQCQVGNAAGDLAADAYLAAGAIELGCTLVSYDRDFARFPALRWRVPTTS